MSRVLWHRSMSLDGFVASPDRGMSWMDGATHDQAMVEEIIATTGAILAGRRGYDEGSKDHPGETAKQAYGDAWDGPVFVLTHHPEDTVPEENLTFLNCDIEEAIRIGLEAANGKNLEIFGSDVVGQAALRGLVDELVIHLAPVMLGDGVRMFDSVGTPPIRWELVERGGGETGVSLRYRPIRPAR